MATVEESIVAIKDSRPPVTEAFTYLTIIETHLRPETLSTLQEVLRDTELTQSIGWDLIQILLPIPGSEECLTTIARLGNPREVILKVTEALALLEPDVEGDENDEDDGDDGDDEDGKVSNKKEQSGEGKATERTMVDKFCILVGLLAILHPRIKTKYPSRFLSTSLIAVLSAYQPTHQATQAITTFIHAISVQKRPMLPQRSSSMASLKLLRIDSNGPVAPDPEAAEEDSGETAIQKKLLQSFVTHIIEEYVKENSLEWAARLQEHFRPSKVIPNRQSVGDSFKENPDLQERDMCIGQLAARARDLGLSGHSFLFESLDSVSPPSDDDDSDDDDTSPTSPDDIPLSKAGCLFLVTSSIFSSILFDTKAPLPPLKLFPDHAALVSYFIGSDGPTTIGTENESIIDSLLAIGLWLEHSNAFVAGPPLDDEDFLQDLQSISLISANTPSPSLRYHAHLLTANLLHDHPIDRVRLTFIIDTLEHCPYENLKGSAVSWLREELILANERRSSNIFSTTLALASAQPYLFSDMRPIDQATDSEIWEEIQSTFPFTMAVLNFVLFLTNEKWGAVVPDEMLAVAHLIYVDPLKKAVTRLEGSLQEHGALRKKLGNGDARRALSDVELLGERLASCSQIPL